MRAKQIIQEVSNKFLAPCQAAEKLQFKNSPFNGVLCNSIFLLRISQIIVLGSVWEETKLHEHCNPYIETVCDLCALLWYCLSRKTAFPDDALKFIWENLIRSGYVALLDGFSKVSWYCSTEGRALMSMDLASYTSGISRRSLMERLDDSDATLCPPPPVVSPNQGMAYVDTWVKVFYYPRLVSCGF